MKSNFIKNNSNKGFSLAEMLIYIGILGASTWMIAGILSTVTRTSVEQGIQNEITGQLNFSIQTIQRFVKESNSIDIPSGTTQKDLVLRTGETATDPTVISLQNGRLFIKQGDNQSQPITSSDVVVNSLEFRKFSNPNAKDIVQIDVSMSGAEMAAGNKITRSLRSAVSTAYAITFNEDATFSGDILPDSTANARNVGKSSTDQIWATVIANKFCLDGDTNCVDTSWSAGSGLPSGSSNGQTLRYDGTNWVVNSMICNNGTKIGINLLGTDCFPDATLDVNGMIKSYGILPLANTAPYGTPPVLGDVLTALLPDGTAVWSSLPEMLTGQPGGIETGTAGQTLRSALRSDGISWIANSLIYNNGAGVGIGTVSPAAKLEVAGSVKIVDGTQGNGKILTSDANGLASWQSPAAGGGVSSVALGTNGGLTISPTTGAVTAAIDTSGNLLTCTNFTTNKILWDSTNKKLVCGTDQSGVTGSGNLKYVAVWDSVNGLTYNSNGLYTDTDGNVGVGKTGNPLSYKLDVNGNTNITGTIKITGGSPGAGKVLTSDASGLASWQTTIGGSGTANFIPKFTASQTLGNSRINDDGTSIAMGNSGSGTSFHVDNSGATLQYARAIMITFSNDGRIGLGMDPGTYSLRLSSDSAAKPNGGSWTNPSDERVKKDIKPFTDGLSTIININPVWYKYNGKGGYVADGKNYVGIIAQDVKNVAPYTVGSYKAKLNPNDTEETELLDFNSSALTFVLINSIKELNSKINLLENRINELEGKIE